MNSTKQIKQKITCAILCLCLMFLSGCGLLKQKRVKQIVVNSVSHTSTTKPDDRTTTKDSGLVILSYPTELRGSFFKGNFFCAEPFPDVAVGENLTINVKAEKSVDIKDAITPLKGRSEAVLIAREMLYRLCEMSSNYQIASSDLKDTYGKVVDAIVTIADTEKVQAVEALLKAAGQKEVGKADLLEIMNAL